MNKILTIITLTKNNPIQLEKTLLSLKKYKKLIGISKNLIIDGSNFLNKKENQKIYKKFSNTFELTHLKDPSSGIYCAMNLGLINTHTRYVLFMNSGDIFSNEFNENLLIKYLNLYKSSNKINLIYCRAKIKSIINKNIFFFNPAKFTGNRKKILLSYIVPPSHQACFFKTKWHKKNPYVLNKGYRADRILIKKAIRKSLFISTTSTIFFLDGISSLNSDIKTSFKNTLKTKSIRLILGNFIKIFFIFFLKKNWEYIRYIKHIVFSLIP